ncbi:hypothetical protein FNF31_01558 [Cafeteria roenbergensis]|uniref:Uncharacterized protein n=1 Tax=Cafeteria roenbergensis TaxID=33653 RepID=A0A5A8DNQ2_CAFRO|nr:hypothetical protein FNF31_01558 [Cafeteria roenbergensis]
MDVAAGFDSGSLYGGETVTAAAPGVNRVASRRAPAFIAGASLEDGSVAISLTSPMRLLPPKSFHAPARAPLRSPSVVTEDAVIKALFDRLKMKTRTAVSGMALSAKSDLRLLAASSRRSGATSQGAVQKYCLGVTHDNNESFRAAMDAYKSFIKARTPRGSHPRWGPSRGPFTRCPWQD